MKKIWIALLLIVCLACSLVACTDLGFGEEESTLGTIASGNDNVVDWNDLNPDNGTGGSTEEVVGGNPSDTSESGSKPEQDIQGGIGNAGANTEGGWGEIHPA